LLNISNSKASEDSFDSLKEMIFSDLWNNIDELYTQIEQIQFSTIKKLFKFFYNYMNNSLGSDFPFCFSTFIAENFISSSPSITVIIQMSYQSNPSSMLYNYI
jgi:hypothetical protein